MDGGAARPKDIFPFREAGAQAVGRAGGAAGAVFDRRRGLLFLPLREFLLSGPGEGRWGVGTTLARDDNSLYIHALESQSPFL